jgi:bifunctional pyridoxal-dependent enzyme with beta-cystathionase and maltose regulon repressor activities
VSELEHVAEICLRRNLFIISDEIHFDLLMPGVHHHVFSTLDPEIARRAVICTAPSKTFNIPGLKASNAIIADRGLRERYERTLQMNDAHPGLNIMAYKAVEIAYTQCEKWLDEALAVIDSNRRFVEEFMRTNIPTIRVLPLEGTYLQWWDCQNLHLSDDELRKFIQKDALLWLDEGEAFGKAGRGYERINLACPAAVLAGALTRLKDAYTRKLGAAGQGK